MSTLLYYADERDGVGGRREYFKESKDIEFSPMSRLINMPTLGPDVASQAKISSWHWCGPRYC